MLRSPGSRVKLFQKSAKLNSPLHKVRVEKVLNNPVPPSTVGAFCRSDRLPS